MRAFLLSLLVVAASAPALCQHAPPTLDPGPPDPQGITLPSGEKLYHLGGPIKKPILIHQEPAEFSEEAKKAKFSGKVEIHRYVDTNGDPKHLAVVRGVGMGLDVKALEAVRKYKFKPATLNGEPVMVDLYIEVNFVVLR